MDTDLPILKERIINSYEESYDLGIAFMKNGVQAETAAMLRRDEDFMYRVHYAEACMRERLIGTLKTGLTSSDEKLAHKAALDLGNVLWPEKFKGKADGIGNTNVPDKIILTGKK